MRWQRLTITLLLFLLCFGVAKGQSNSSTPVGMLEPIIIDNLENINELTVIDAEAGVIDIAFGSDSGLMAYVTTTSLNLWDIPTQSLRWSVPIESGGSIAFSPDSTLLAARVNYNLSLWDVETGEQQIALTTATQQKTGYITDLAFVENRNELVGVAALGGQLVRWKADTGEFVSEYSYGFNEYVRADYSILSPDGTLNVLGRVTNSIELRNTVRGDIRNRVQLDELLEIDTSEIPIFIMPLAISSDNQTIIISLTFADGSQPNLLIWLSSGGDVIHRVEHGHGLLWTGTFNLDGKITVLGNRDIGEIYLWNTDTGEEIATLTGHTDWVTTLTFSPDGTLLASGGTDGTVRLWGVPADLSS